MMEYYRDKKYKHFSATSRREDGNRNWIRKNHRTLTLFAGIILFAFVLFLILQGLFD